MNNGEEIGSINIDISGIYITGAFYGTANFGSTILISSGANDLFLTKYDFNGNCLWAKRAGGIGMDYGHGITLDGLGNLYLIGTNTNTATFESTTIPAGGAS